MSTALHNMGAHPGFQKERKREPLREQIFQKVIKIKILCLQRSAKCILIIWNFKRDKTTNENWIEKGKPLMIGLNAYSDMIL